MRISVRKALELIQNDFSIIILDVRTKEEFDEKHIAKAINLDLTSSSFEEEIDKLDRNKKYLVYCRSGNRSSMAELIMLKKGFNEVYSVDGFLLE